MYRNSFLVVILLGVYLYFINANINYNKSPLENISNAADNTKGEKDNTKLAVIIPSAKMFVINSNRELVLSKNVRTIPEFLDCIVISKLESRERNVYFLVKTNKSKDIFIVEERGLIFYDEEIEIDEGLLWTYSR